MQYIITLDKAPAKKGPSGLVSIICNDLLYAATWTVDAVLRWTGHRHINVLELSTFGALLRRVALEAADSRISLIGFGCRKGHRGPCAPLPFSLLPFLRSVLFSLPTVYMHCSDLRQLGSLPPTPLAEILSTEAVHGLGELPFRRDLASWARLSRLSLGLLGHPVQVAPYPGELAVEVAVGAVADVLQACGRVFDCPKPGL